MVFYPGIHHPHIAHHFPRCLISVNTLRRRKTGFEVGDWILDSGAFTEIATYGRYRTEPEAYGEQIIRWSTNGNLLAAVSQDMMCEPWIEDWPHRRRAPASHHRALRPHQSRDPQPHPHHAGAARI